MFVRILKGTFIFATAALAVPYTLSLIGNILYGWPQCRNKYRRAFSPQKVFGFNYAVYQMVRDQAKLAFLYLKWRKFYSHADPQRVLKDIPYGRNNNFLDLYVPDNHKRSKSKLPVMIFIYGGSWSSGDKNMYGLLCSELTTAANVVAMCPDYSRYPKGYVDDMIQDVVDCIIWAIENIEKFGGDSNKIILMGHSAGAHLCAMSLLEMLHEECTSIQQSFRFQPVDKDMGELNFAESYYGSSGLASKWKREGLEDSSGSSESFTVVSEHGYSSENGAGLKVSSSQARTSLLVSTLSEGFTHISSDSEGEEASQELKEELLEDSVSMGSRVGDGPSMEDKEKESHKDTSSFTDGGSSTGGSVADEEDQDDDSGDNDSIVTVRPKDIEGQINLAEASKSVKGFIGIAGVYSISDHFRHEYSRGVEDVSKMSRAFYGVDHFDRFSPTQIVKRFGQYLSLPPVVLLHGTKDYIVPLSSTNRFAEVLSEISANVKVRLIPDAPHYEIVVDLMDKNRTFYSQVMSIVMETVKQVS